MSKDHIQLGLSLNGFFRNRGLFADHFLEHRLADLPEWKTTQGLDDAITAIEKVYREKAVRFNDRTNEPQTERDFVRPVLDVLWKDQTAGDCYQVQVTIPNVDARRQPDYAFFRTAADRDSAESRKGALEYWRDVPVLGDAKAWSSSLDKRRGFDENPSSQVANYLYRSRVRWAILTNGRLWRIYEREKSSAGGIFFEVDLEDILRRKDFNGFKYFYFFFRREAFLPDGTGKSFLDKVFQGSIDYAADVGDRLKESVYDALRILMNGLFEHSANGLNRDQPETLKLVHENCLILLYRLLFLLYAEDRGLLPRSTEPYATYSLYRLQREINQHLRDGKTYPPVAHRFWGEITNLFLLIDKGFPEGGIPAYNGGLFNPSHYPHIAHTQQPNEARWDIGDRFLGEAIDLLAYKRERWDQPASQDIDYASLEVQHLGSIYEGLLELQPHVASESLVETLDEGKPVFKPSREVVNRRPIRGQLPRTVRANEIYLTTNRGERKATGSYYTPKYIVDYIVENTVGYLIDEAARKVKALAPSVLREIRKLQRGRREWERHSTENAARQIKTFDKGIEEQKRRLLEPYLSLKILDPAMGSGHFLVGAADFLSMAMATDPNLLVPGDIGDEDPQVHYKRLVVEHCLYGVDLNPLAVELAKLSLWLHTVSQDKALSFLDHHMRCGNSLIGASVDDDLMREPPQFNARGRCINANRQQLVLGFSEALRDRHLVTFLKLLRAIGETTRHDAEGEKFKETLYAELEAERERFRSVANCWLAPYFGVGISPHQYEEALSALRGSDSDWQALVQQQWFQCALRVAEEKRFFHWELEFPEVFFETSGFKPVKERGFDAVIGNPPWGATFEENEKAYNRDRFQQIIVRMVDSFMFFIYRGKNLVRANGLEGEIVPSPFFLQVDVKNLRRYLLDTCLITLLNLGDGIFGPEVTAPCCVFVLMNDSCEQSNHLVHVSDITQLSIEDKIRSLQNDELNYRTVPQEFYLQSHNFAFITKGFLATDVVLKARRQGRPLSELIDGEIQRGISADLNDAFIVTEDTRRKEQLETSVCLPVVLGRNIGRYSLSWSTDYILYLTRDDDIKQFAQARAHLQKFQHQISCKEVASGRHPWYALHRPRDRRIFASPKILGLTTTDRLIVTSDLTGYFAMDALYIFHVRNTVSIAYLLGLLNSELLTFIYRYLAQEEGRVLPQVKAENLYPLPIRRINMNTPRESRARLVQNGQTLYEQFISEGNERFMLEFIELQLSQTPEHADVVHDLIAFLVEQMIEMNEAKLTEVKGFLSWLERALRTEVDLLSNKTRILAYHEGDLQVLVSILRTNQRRLGAGINVSSRRFQEDLEREFNASLVKLNPLKTKIAVTDNLIDEIVFRLYGLTDVEIKLVKGESEAAGGLPPVGVGKLCRS